MLVTAAFTAAVAMLPRDVALDELARELIPAVGKVSIVAEERGIKVTESLSRFATQTLDPSRSIVIPTVDPIFRPSGILKWVGSSL